MQCLKICDGLKWINIYFADSLIYYLHVKGQLFCQLSESRREIF